jgi:hypothetical protein
MLPCRRIFSEHINDSDLVRNLIQPRFLMNKKPNKELLKFIGHYGALRPNSRFTYVPIHRMQNEGPVAPPLKPQERVRIVDCYWALGDNGLFVSFSFDQERPNFVSYTPRKGETIAHDLCVITKSELTAAIIERILEKLAAWFEKNRLNLPHVTTVVARSDFGSSDAPHG